MRRQQARKQRKKQKQTQMTALMASLAPYDNETKADTINAILPTLEDGTTKTRLQDYVDKL
jgi:hypothetical protein